MSCCVLIKCSVNRQCSFCAKTSKNKLFLEFFSIKHSKNVVKMQNTEKKKDRKEKNLFKNKIYYLKLKQEH